MEKGEDHILQQCTVYWTEQQLRDANLDASEGVLMEVWNGLKI